MHKFRSSDDCSQRLRNCVIIHKGRPIYVKNIKSSSVVSGHDLITREDVEVKLTAESVAAPRLGYVNYGNRVYFLYRKPVRKVRQGLCGENVTSNDGDVGGALLNTSEFGKMLLGDYPSLEECVKRVADRSVVSMAFSRRFAVRSFARESKSVCLIYAGNKIGRIDVQTMEVHLDEGFECFKEALNAST